MKMIPFILLCCMTLFSACLNHQEGRVNSIDLDRIGYYGSDPFSSPKVLLDRFGAELNEDQVLKFNQLLKNGGVLRENDRWDARNKIIVIVDGSLYVIGSSLDDPDLEGLYAHGMIQSYRIDTDMFEAFWEDVTDGS